MHCFQLWSHCLTHSNVYVYACGPTCTPFPVTKLPRCWSSSVGVLYPAGRPVLQYSPFHRAHDHVSMLMSLQLLDLNDDILYRIADELHGANALRFSPTSKRSHGLVIHRVPAKVWLHSNNIDRLSLHRHYFLGGTKPRVQHVQNLVFHLLTLRKLNHVGFKGVGTGAALDFLRSSGWNLRVLSLGYSEVFRSAHFDVTQAPRAWSPLLNALPPSRTYTPSESYLSIPIYPSRVSAMLLAPPSHLYASFLYTPRLLPRLNSHILCQTCKHSTMG